MFNFSNVFRTLSTAVSNGATAQMRLNQYGEQVTSNPLLQNALEGSMFTISTPTPGVGIALAAAAQTTFDATKPWYTIRNPDAAKDIIVKRIKHLVTAAGGGYTALDMAIYLDTTNRIQSGGTAVGVTNGFIIHNTRTVSGSIASVLNANTAIVATAANLGQTTIFHTRKRLRNAIPVVGDEYILNFGVEGGSSSIATNGTAPQIISHNETALVIPPGCTALFYYWGTSMSTVPQFELDIETVER